MSNIQVNTHTIIQTSTRTVGRCLTERKRVDFDAMASNCIAFGRVSQFSVQPRNALELPTIAEHFETVSTLTQIDNLNPIAPAIHTGTILYGIRADNGELTWLGEVIDSSD